MSSILALIPARGGSKRIPNKNTKILCDLPLIAHSLRTAQAADCFRRIVVSTDDKEIAAVARTYGGEVPWLRSGENSNDNSSTLDALLEVINCIEDDGDALPDAVMLLQPTSPFRSVASIHRALEIFDLAYGDSVVSVSPADTHPYWYKQVSQQGELLPFLHDADGTLCSQELPPVYMLNGLIYTASLDTIRNRHSLYSDHTRALIIDSPEEALDIDTPFDWRIAEAICSERRKELI